MPDRGSMQPSLVADVAFASGGSLLVENASWLQVTFEVERHAALAHMPCEVGRPIPPYGRLFVAVAPGFQMALLSIGGRYRMMPRNVVVEAVTNQAERATGAFGTGIRAGEVTLARSGQDVSAEIRADGESLLTLSLANIYAIEPTMLRWDAFVALARADGNAVIGEVTPAHRVETAFLSKEARVTLDPSLARDHAWRQLRSLSVISACYAEGTLNFGETVVQQTWA